jgi:superfamily II DNA or RNA helicase
MPTIDSQLKKLYIQRDSLALQISQLENQKQTTSKNFIVLKDAIYINTTILSAELIHKLEIISRFDNPQVKILLNLRKPLYNTARKINSYEKSKNEIILPRGLMREVIRIFREYGLDTSYIDERIFFVYKFKKIKYILRDEQQKAVNHIIKKDFSLCVAPPGFGKTLIGSKMIELRGCNTLVIVNKNILLDQWIERFIDYFEYEKKDIGYLGKSKNTLNGILDIATMQSLKNNTQIIKNYSFVIVDECHHIPALTFEKIIKEFCGKYILGLSATPNRKDGMEPIIFQQLGSIAYEIKSKKKFTNILKIVETEFESSANSFTQLISDIVNNNERNILILQEIIKYKKRKILLLTDRIEHIEHLELLLTSNKIEFVSVHGSLKKNEQVVNMKKINTTSVALATTSFFGEGIDLPHLNTIIFATPISYYGRLVQYLGRIGRGGEDCLAIDILDINNPFALSSYKKRKEGYTQLHYRRTK